jgi:hypothetical protein
MNNPGMLVFDNLISARGVVSGGTIDKVQTVRPESFVASNARGGLRTVSSFEEVASIARDSADSFAKAFCPKTN